MAKKIKSIVKLNIKAGQATPAPPVGTALGPHGINIGAFCKDYNAQTASQSGTIVPAVVTIYEDSSFTFITKTSPTTDLIKKALGIEKGSRLPGNEIVSEISQDKIREVAQIKMQDLNSTNIESAMRIIEGSARSMGITIKE